MNIHAKSGMKVIFAYPTAGYPHHQDTAKAHLAFGKVYTVARTEVGGWHTDVYLAEVPKVAFNSCHFDDFVSVENGT